MLQTNLRMRIGISMLVFGTCILWFCQPIRVLVSCPFCERFTKSLDDDIKRVDALFLVQFEPNKADPLARQSGTVLKVLKRPSSPTAHRPSGGVTATTGQKKLSDEWAQGSIVRFSKEVAVANESTFTAIVFANRSADQSSKATSPTAEKPANEWIPIKVMRRPAEAMVNHLTKLALLANKGMDERLGYLFGLLDSTDVFVAEDAYKEFGKASYSQTRLARHRFDRAKLRHWLTHDSPIPPLRLSLVGFLLGLAGSQEDVPFLVDLVRNPTPRIQLGYDGVVGGLLVLDPAAGLSLASDIVSQEKLPITRRRLALSAIVFFEDEHAHEIDRTKIAGLIHSMNEPELAATIIDLYRRLQNWDHTERIAQQLTDPRCQEAVVRYLLTCPQDSCKLSLTRVEREMPSVIRQAEQQLAMEKDLRKKNQNLLEPKTQRK